MNELEVDATDAIRLILQFLKENRLFNAMKALQGESQISLNAVDSVETLLNDIRHGRWDTVLQQTKSLECSEATMMALYELIAIEMIESNEKDVARELLRKTAPLMRMKDKHAERYRRLEKLWQATSFSANEAYGRSSKQQKREDVAEQLKREVTEVLPSRLLSLLGQALKWQRMQGMVAPGTDVDIFRGVTRTSVVERTDRLIRKSAGKIKFSKNSTPQCASFTSDGYALVTGTKDGFVEVWDFDKCKLRKDLEYQAKDEFMMHDQAITAEAFSRDGELLATGSEDGKLKVWKLTSGVCLRCFERAHSNSIHSICFSRDGTQLLTASFDQLVRIHGLKSGKTLKEFHGHDGFVNAAIFSDDGSRVLSSSCDGTLKIWDAKTTECLQTIRPPNGRQGVEVDVFSALLVADATGEQENVVVCTRSNAMYLMTLTGQELVTFHAKALDGSDVGSFVDCSLSPRGKWLYGVTDKGFLLCFDASSGVLEVSMQVTKGDAFGLAHHPHRNVIATFGTDGYVRLWKA